MKILLRGDGRGYRIFTQTCQGDVRTIALLVELVPSIHFTLIFNARSRSVTAWNWVSRIPYNITYCKNTPAVRRFLNKRLEINIHQYSRVTKLDEWKKIIICEGYKYICQYRKVVSKYILKDFFRWWKIDDFFDRMASNIYTNDRITRDERQKNVLKVIRYKPSKFPQAAAEAARFTAPTHSCAQCERKTNRNRAESGSRAR